MNSVKTVFICLLLTASNLSADDQLPKVRVVLVGDSTVTDGAGWGGAFARRLVPAVDCRISLAAAKARKTTVMEGGGTRPWSKSRITC